MNLSSIHIPQPLLPRCVTAGRRTFICRPFYSPERRQKRDLRSLISSGVGDRRQVPFDNRNLELRVVRSPLQFSPSPTGPLSRAVSSPIDGYRCSRTSNHFHFGNRSRLPRSQFGEWRASVLHPVCSVSGASFHVVRSFVASRGLSPCWRSIQHGAFHNVLRYQPQNFAARHDRFLPVRETCLPDFDGGASGERVRRDRFNIGEVAVRSDPSFRRASGFDDSGVRPGFSRRCHSVHSGMDQGSGPLRTAHRNFTRTGGSCGRRIGGSR